LTGSMISLLTPFGRSTHDTTGSVSEERCANGRDRVWGTKLGGEIMMMGNELGQVKPGFLADIILVDGNPLANVKILADATKLLAIMKDGQFHKEPQVAKPAERQIA